jgi:hypothetical protein
MPGDYAPSAWSEIIAQAAVSPLGISALVILVVGFTILALVRRGDTVATRLTSIILLLIFCAGLVAVAFYKVQPSVTRPETSPSYQTVPTSPALPPTSPPPAPPASTRLDCGTAWSAWIDVGGAVGNPCPSGCSRGDELGQSYRVVGLPPRPQTQHKFQCWHN